MSNHIFDFFGLRENPFRINPDPRFLVLTPELHAASEELTYAIQARKGLILLTGEVGTGKTMLVRRLLNWLAEQNMPTALIFNARLNPDHLLDLILNDFAISCSSTLKSEKLISLNNWLLERYRASHLPVLIVDEAQGMPIQVLEEIRLLLNFETPREKLLQIVLAGQPELNDTLKRHELRQLRQRITVRCKTAPLSLQQTHTYINERLRIAGATTPIFDPQAMSFVHSYAHGIPRVINVLCEHALIDSCADGSKLVMSRHVEQAARDCQLERVDSVSRILNSGSYARTSLDEIGSILASVSATSPSSKILTTAPLQPQTRPPFEPTPRAYDRAFPDAPSRPSALPAQPSLEPSPRVQPESRRQERLPDVPATYDRLLHAGAIRIPSRPLPAWLAMPLHYLHLWGASFSADAQFSLRRLRKSLESARLRHWLPIRRELRLRTERLLFSVSRFLDDPRWAQWLDQFSRQSRAAWRDSASQLRSWLERPFRTTLAERQQPSCPDWRNRFSSTLTRAKRHRSMATLRRWLQKPLDRRVPPRPAPPTAPQTNRPNSSENSAL